jgi:RNA polymerase sigma factor (sigma-70 family)
VPEGADAGADPALAVQQGDLRSELFRALSKVPPRQRAVLVLRYFESLSVAETAEALGCSEGTVKSQAARGLATMRAALDGAALTALGSDFR